MGHKRRKLQNKSTDGQQKKLKHSFPTSVSCKPMEKNGKEAVGVEGSAHLASQRETVLPSSFDWNPVVNFEVDKSTKNVSKYVTDCHKSSEILRFENCIEVNKFMEKFGKNPDGVQASIVYSKDGFYEKGEADGFLIRLSETYELKSILKLVPNLEFLSLKCSGDDDTPGMVGKGSEGFPCMKNLKGVEIATHCYSGLAKKVLEAYGSQLNKLVLQDLDCEYELPPNCKGTLNIMFKSIGGINGIFRNVEELRICSLRNSRVLSSISRVVSPMWNLKRLAINVTCPNDGFRFDNFHELLNRFSDSLEEVHLDVFGFRSFVEAFYGYNMIKAWKYPQEALPRLVCPNVKILTLPALVLVCRFVLGYILMLYFPNIEKLRFLRWKRKWPMTPNEHKGLPQKVNLGKIFKEYKIVLPKMVEVKVLKQVDIENDEDIVYFKSYKV